MEQWLRRTTPVTPERSLHGSTDLELVARDGVERAHQALLARHSPALRKLFWGLGRLTDVELINSKIPGIKPRLKEAREPAELVTLLLPDYGIGTISALLDLLYEGKSKNSGQYTVEGELELVGLYQDFGIEKEYGGLPAIHLLEEEEIVDRKFPACQPMEFLEVVSSTTDVERIQTRETRREVPPIQTRVIQKVTEELAVSCEQTTSSGPLQEEEKDASESSVMDRKDDEEVEAMDIVDNGAEPCDVDTECKAESRLQSPEPEIEELLGEESDNSRPSSRLSTKEEEPFNHTALLPSETEAGCSGALEQASSPKTSDKSKRKRICLRKKSSSESDPEHSSCHGFSDNDVDEMVRKRRRSVLGEEYDKSLLRAKERRVSKNSDEIEKTSVSSSEETLQCPMDDCLAVLGGDLERCAKHLIKHHLSNAPSSLYTDEKDSGRHKCRSCDFSSSSSSTFWAHMAVKHRELHTRLGRALEGQDLSDEEARIYRVIDTFWKQVWRRGKDKEASEHKPKILAKVFASSDASKQRQTLKKKSVAVTSAGLACSSCGKKSKTWRKLKEHILVKHLKDKLVNHFEYHPDENTFSCEYGQECSVQRRKKADIAMHLHCKHQLVTEKQVLEFTKENILVEQEAEQEAMGSSVTSPETVAVMNRRDCEVQIYNILDGVDFPSDVSDISNYHKLRNPRQQKLSSSHEVGEDNKESKCKGRSQLNSSKREKTPGKMRKEAKILEQEPELFTSPVVLRPPAFPTVEREQASTTGVHPTAPKLMAKSVDAEKEKIACQSLDSEKSSAEVGQPGSRESEEATAGGLYTCRWCFYKYDGDEGLKKHLLSKHKDEFMEVGLLEAGEKYYECLSEDCKKLSKTHTQFKNKSRVIYMRHLKEVHHVPVLDLLRDETELGSLFNFKEFCEKQKDAMLSHLIEEWKAPPVLIKTVNTRLEPELVQLEDEEVEEIQFESLDIQPVANEEDVQDSPEVEAMGKSSNQEEESQGCLQPQSDDINQIEGGNEFTCQVCDRTFPRGLEVSLHMFQEHLKGLTSVWEPLVRPASPAAFPHSWTCALCSDTFPTRSTAQLHIYSESRHKRMLKRSMEERGENWQHTLEFVRFKISVENIPEDEEDSNFNSYTAKEEAQYIGEELVTSSTTETTDVTAELTAEDNRITGEPELLDVQPSAKNNVSSEPLSVGGTDLEPELDYEPDDEEISDGHSSSTRQTSSTQDVELKDGGGKISTAAEIEKAIEGVRDNLVETDQGAFETKGVDLVEEAPRRTFPCSHSRAGCNEVFSERTSLHSHARRCRYRPQTSFLCPIQDCGKSYYYEEDFKRHSQQCRNKSKFKCPDCGLSSSLLKELIEHKNVCMKPV